MLPKTLNRVLLLSILLLSAGLRLHGNRWGLPTTERLTPLYVDEYTPLHWLSRMDPRHLDFNPRDFRVPTFFYYQVGVALQSASWLGYVQLSRSQVDYLQHPEHYARLYEVGRFLTTLYGIALTLLLFFLGKRISGEDTGGLFSALFYAVIPLAVVSCHIIDVGVPVSFCLGFCFFSLLTAVQDNKPRWLLIGALAAGLSLSTKYTSAPVFLVVAYALWRMRARPAQWITATAISVGGFLLGTPYALLDHPLFLAGFKKIAHDHAVNAPHTLHQFWMPFSQYPFAVGTILSIVCLLGLGKLLARKNPAAIMAALYLVPYLFLLGKSPFHITRYLNETLPFLLPFGSLLLLPAYGFKHPVFRALLLIACLSQVPYTLAINRSLASEIDPRDRASEWVCTHIPPRSTIGLEYEANFLTPGHLYMQYWKGQRYPANSVRPPDYHVVVWDADHDRWPVPTPAYWIQNNLLYSGMGRKDPVEIASVQKTRALMETGFHPIQSFERTLHWGPFQYDLPRSSGWEWIIFFPKITVYEKNQ